MHLSSLFVIGDYRHNCLFFSFLLQSDVVPVIAFLGIFQESCMFLYSKVMFFSSFFFHFKFSLSLQDVFISNNI